MTALVITTTRFECAELLRQRIRNAEQDLGRARTVVHSAIEEGTYVTPGALTHLLVAQHALDLWRRAENYAGRLAEADRDWALIESAGEIRALVIDDVLNPYTSRKETIADRCSAELRDAEQRRFIEATAQAAAHLSQFKNEAARTRRAAATEGKTL